MDTAEIRRLIQSVPIWWHSIEVAPGLWTPGKKTRELLRGELDSMRFDDLDVRNKSVIDIGAWDGFFSFEAEKRGAAQVLALDRFVWCLDLPRAFEYREKCLAEGVVPEPVETLPDIWHPETLPGKRGFDVARELLGSRVEPRVGDLMEIDLDELGLFDVALYLGVLYHVPNPFEALKRLARITREVAVIETKAILVPGYEANGLCEFFETNELNADPTNWWAPNEKALLGMCRAAGFRKVKPVGAKPPEPRPRERTIGQRLRGQPRRPPRPLIHYRAVVHAFK